MVTKHTETYYKNRFGLRFATEKEAAEDEGFKDTPAAILKERAKKELQSCGFVVPADAKFYRVDCAVGMQVGGYEHRCHIESSDIKVLLIGLDKEKQDKCPYVEEFWDNYVEL